MTAGWASAAAHPANLERPGLRTTYVVSRRMESIRTLESDPAAAQEAAPPGAVAAGDRGEPLAELYRRYGRRLYGLGLHLLRDPRAGGGARPGDVRAPLALLGPLRSRAWKRAHLRLHARPAGGRRPAAPPVVAAPSRTARGRRSRGARGRRRGVRRARPRARRPRGARRALAQASPGPRAALSRRHEPERRSPRTSVCRSEPSRPEPTTLFVLCGTSCRERELL